MSDAQTPARPEAAVLADVDLALRADDLERAARVAERAVEEGSGHPLLLGLAAYRLKERGRFAEAIDMAVRAHKTDPQDVTVLRVLADALAHQNRFDEALKVLDEALRLNPDYAEGHYGRGVVLEALGQLQGAMDCYRRANELEPNYPGPLAGAASLALRLGEFERARGAAEQALKLGSRRSGALLTLAQLDLAETHPEHARVRLETALAGGALTALHVPDARVLLGDALDAEGKRAEAFASWSSGKAAWREMYASTYARPGLETAPQLVARLTRQFEALSPAVWSGPVAAPAEPPPCRQHVFLVGFPRSGTTLLEQVLASHEDIVTLEERETLIDAEVDLISAPDGLEYLADLEEAALARYRDGYWGRVASFRLPTPGRVFVDKLPLNSIKLPLIAKLFPRAKVLLARRDPRDVVFSCFRQNFRPNAFMHEFTTLEGAAGLYDAVMRLMSLYEERLPLDRRLVRYEDLVADFEAQTRAVCEFLGVAWSPAMADFAETAKARPIRTPSARQVARGLYASGVGRWRPYAEQLASILPVLEPWVEAFGYGETAAGAA
ncbi:MAG TPA: sulfotransferase [Caulobacteraceae bacterium]|jgi:tetratricopeptide (TPR) repeat protein